MSVNKPSRPGFYEYVEDGISELCEIVKHDEGEFRVLFTLNLTPYAFGDLKGSFGPRLGGVKIDNVKCKCDGCNA